MNAPVGWLLVLVVSTGSVAARALDEPGDDVADRPPTLGLESGSRTFEGGGLTLELLRSSQTASALRPAGVADFDFTPSHWLERRAADRYFHLGDLTLRWKQGEGSEWRGTSTAEARRPVRPLAVPPRMGESPSGEASILAAADLAPTLPDDLPLAVRRFWEVRDGHLLLRFEVENVSREPVEIGALGIPLIFDNILTDRSLDEAHAQASFHDPYIGRDAGYLQVVRLSGAGPVLVVVPFGETPFEAYNPLLDDPTPRQVTFEGFYEWSVHSRALADQEWGDADSWNRPTSVTLAPGESRSYGVAFLLAEGVRRIEEAVLQAGRPVAIGVPGTVLPLDVEGRLFLQHDAAVASMVVEPAGALSIAELPPTRGGWRAFDVRGRAWGRARLTIVYDDGLEQTIHYKVIEPASEVVSDLGRFLTTEQWFERPDDPFGRSPSVISYDVEARRQVEEDDRAWIAGLGDEGGSAWLTAVMKQLIAPDAGELALLERFVDEVVWGGLQYSSGERAFGVRKSLFYWEPDSMPDGTYDEEVDYGGWSSWDREHAESVGRSYDYPHVAALHWVLYRLARNHRGLVTHHPWEWYLERAYETSVAMTRLAPRYAQYGQMEGTVFLLILRDLQREGWGDRAGALEEEMRKRAEVWRTLGFPFASEMPWDSTAQEEVYAWSRYFGYDDKADVTLSAILAYMPTVPHWGYNGSARRYWDFLYAGKLRRVERQLHHYGSGLNAIPVLNEYRDHPDDLYLLRVGYGGVLGAIANVTREGFGPCGFHAYPSTLRIDGYSGDYGPGFFGHALNAATYVVHDPELGWLAFGGNLRREGDAVTVEPLDAARSRIYLAPLGLWLTLDAGTFESVTLAEGSVRLSLSARSAATPVARLRIEQPARSTTVGRFAPEEEWAVERGALVIQLAASPTEVVLSLEDPRGPFD